MYNKYYMRKLFLLLLVPCFCFAAPTSVVYNVSNGEVIQGSLNSEQVSIASISKLLTVYTVLKEKQDLTEKLKVTSSRTPNTKLQKGMILTRKELVNMALISSDNVAAITLSQHYPGGQPSFINKMNDYARTLGMHNSGFVEPTGLSPMNHSSVNDLILLTNAVSVFDIVKNAAQSQKVITTPEGVVIKKKKKNTQKKRKQHRPSNNNFVLTSKATSNYFGQNGVITIKTGFTRAAGFCITMLVVSNNQLYNIIVLGARTKQERQKILDKSFSTIQHV